MCSVFETSLLALITLLSVPGDREKKGRSAFGKMHRKFYTIAKVHWSCILNLHVHCLRLLFIETRIGKCSRLRYNALLICLRTGLSRYWRTAIKDLMFSSSARTLHKRTCIQSAGHAVIMPHSVGVYVYYIRRWRESAWLTFRNARAVVSNATDLRHFHCDARLERQRYVAYGIAAESDLNDVTSGGLEE